MWSSNSGTRAVGHEMLQPEYEFVSHRNLTAVTNGRSRSCSRRKLAARRPGVLARSHQAGTNIRRRVKLLPRLAKFTVNDVSSKDEDGSRGEVPTRFTG